MIKLILDRDGVPSWQEVKKRVKLTAEQREEIRQALHKNSTDLAAQYGVSAGTIKTIRRWVPKNTVTGHRI